MVIVEWGCGDLNSDEIDMARIHDILPYEMIQQCRGDWSFYSNPLIRPPAQSETGTEQIGHAELEAFIDASPMHRPFCHIVPDYWPEDEDEPVAAFQCDFNPFDSQYAGVDVIMEELEQEMEEWINEMIVNAPDLTLTCDMPDKHVYLEDLPPRVPIDPTVTPYEDVLSFIRTCNEGEVGVGFTTSIYDDFPPHHLFSYDEVVFERAREEAETQAERLLVDAGIDPELIGFGEQHADIHSADVYGDVGITINFEYKLPFIRGQGE